MPFKDISAQDHSAFLSALAAGQYNLLLGAGFSMDSTNSFGNLPSGEALKKELCAVTGASDKHSLQRVFSLLSPSQVKQHVTDRFSNCVPGPTADLLSQFLWRRIFTWNIDDVIQNKYKLRTDLQSIRTVHYSDDYREAPTLSELMVIHLHGTVTEPDRGYVFSREQYVAQLKDINPWMTVLTTFMHSEPIIIAGTSMDEVDLDYYLSFRTTVTARADRGPSILVTSDDDAITRDICKRHQLLHFVGRSHDFFSYCSTVLPKPPTPEELIPAAERALLPAGISKSVALAFHSDFELVPADAKPSESSRFQFGHPPVWGDLAANLDVSRSTTADLIVRIDTLLKDTSTPAKLLLLLGGAGTGKTTILRRTGFELAKRGIRALLCSALSRIDKTAASAIDLIDEPVVVIVDNFADQATAVAELLARLERKDVVVLGAERVYRSTYLDSVLSDENVSVVDRIPFSEAEAAALVGRYAASGNIGDRDAAKSNSNSPRRLRTDPIAIACCRILKDFKPLERIIDDLVGDATDAELERYTVAALAQHCFMGGVRRSILVEASGAAGIEEQINGDTPLPLAYVNGSSAYLAPENSTVADRVIHRAVSHDKRRLLRAFTNLANSLRPYVNRETIIRRAPEARLAGRLFDFDDIVGKLLGDAAEQFYDSTRDLWRWNSRYWEQVSLLKLAQYRRDPDAPDALDHLEDAVRHARNAVAIEVHPFPLTTLGKVLMAQMLVPAYSMSTTYSEAFDNLATAIEKETIRARRSIQPFASLFSGTEKFLERGGKLTDKQRDTLRGYIGVVERRFGKEADLLELTVSIRKLARI